MKKHIIRCYGDSLTKGIPGFSYVNYIKNAKCKNYGIGGDTLLGLKKRINKSNKEIITVIEIGTNDILLPALLLKSKKWNRIIQLKINKGKIPIEDLNVFREKYIEMIDMVTSKKIIIINIPCISENLQRNVNKIVDDYNVIIKEICDLRNLILVDINSWQKKIIEESMNSSDSYFMDDPMMTILDTLVTKIGISDLLSKVRKLSTTIDGVHFNKKTAKYLATKIEGLL